MMGSHAATVDSLITKGKFEPQVAMAIAEAIDNAMSDSQLVTVPILDARFAEFRSEIHGDLVRLENKIDLAVATLDSKIDRSDAALDKKIDVSCAALDSKIDVAVANLGKLNESTKAELVRWVFVAMGCNVVCSGAVVMILNALQHH